MSLLNAWPILLANIGFLILVACLCALEETE